MDKHEQTHITSLDIYKNSSEDESTILVPIVSSYTTSYQDDG